MTGSNRAWSLLAAASLLVTILAPIASLVQARWIENLSLLYVASTAGLVFGTAFGRSRMREGLSYAVGLGLGLTATALLAQSTLARPDTVGGRVASLYETMANWVQVVSQGGFGTDPLIFLLVLLIGAWTFGFFAAWEVSRERNALPALAAGGAILVVNTSYATELVGYVLVFVPATLLLTASVNFRLRERWWEQTRARTESGAWSSVLRYVVALSGLAAFAGWFMPEIPPNPTYDKQIQSITRPAEDFQIEFNRLFGGIRGRGAASLSGFGNTLSLSGEFRLADYPVLRVSSEQSRYWRAVTYERYTGQGWVVAEPVTPTRIEPGAPGLYERFKGRMELVQIVEVLQPRGDYLVAAGDPIRLDIPVNAEIAGRFVGGSINPQRPPDVVSLRAPLAPGRKYQVISSVSMADGEMLRQASSRYPRQVVRDYTQLPAIPPRVKDLAVQLTADKANPYDKARAVESYLRAMPYSLDIAPPPAGRDGVDYFLFDVKKGYCDYYASAMAVMMRSVGVPTRVVSGYATGTRDQPTDPFVVRDSNAHSWVQVYFPEYGWIDFDPSGNQPRIQHPEGLAPEDQIVASPTEAPIDQSSSTIENPDDFPQSDFGSGWLGDLASSETALNIPAGVFMALGAILAPFAIGAALWQANVSGLAPAAAMWTRVVTLATLIGLRRRASETPSEYARRVGDVVPGKSQDVRLIADLYSAFRWSRRRGSRDIRRQSEAWVSIRAALIRSLPRRAAHLPASALKRMLSAWRNRNERGIG